MDDDFDALVGEIVDRMTEAFKDAVRQSSDPDLRPRSEDTGPDNDWRDVRGSNAEHKQAHDSVLALAEQEVIDGILPVIHGVVDKLRAGEFNVRTEGAYFDKFMDRIVSEGVRCASQAPADSPQRVRARRRQDRPLNKVVFGRTRP